MEDGEGSSWYLKTKTQQLRPDNLSRRASAPPDWWLIRQTGYSPTKEYRRFVSGERKLEIPNFLREHSQGAYTS